MIFRKYVFLTGLICFAVLMAQPSSVQASAVIDEVEKAISSEEVQIDEPAPQNISEPQPVEVEEQTSENEESPTEDEDTNQDSADEEEQPSDTEETQTENEDTPQNTKPVEQQTVPSTQINSETKQPDLSDEAPFEIENNSVETVQKEEQEPEKTSNALFISISEFYNQIKNIFSEWLDKITLYRETAIQPSKPYDADVCCRQFPEHKQLTTPKNFVPYYFMYPESVKDYLERIYFSNKITHSTELLPYIYTIKNTEIRYDIPKDAVTPQGITDMGVLLDAPSPKIKVAGKSMFAKLVIDVRNNTLYKYDVDGFPLKAYLIATGARGNRTKTGLRIVTYKEKFPYRGAPKDCKRLTDPYSYGPYIIFMNVVNPKTGRQMYIDQFLHGNGNEKSIGRKVSHGCMRTNNNVMRNELSKEVKRGDYVLIINPDIN